MEQEKYRCKICGQEVVPLPDGSCPVCGAPKEMLKKLANEDEDR